MASVEASLALLEGLGPSTVALGLARMHAALARLQHPEQGLRVLHVAGTNGKGSTCALASAILTASGLRVGLYTSPHLVHVGERLRIDGVPISEARLAQRIDEVRALAPELLEGPDALTYFEALTLLAFWHFSQEAVDVVVLETGLGGRLDATNVCAPAVTVVTPVSIDHTGYLGETLAAIAAEKAGIFKPGVPVILAAQAPEALQVLEARANALGAPVFLEQRDFRLEAAGASDLGFRSGASRIDGLRLSLRGAHQRQNAAVAVQAVQVLLGGGAFVGAAAVREGLRAARWPGRFEVFKGQPTVVLDGAHNPEGAQVLARALEDAFPGRRRHLIFGVLADKDSAGMLAALLPAVDTIRVVAPESGRALSVEDAVRAVATQGREARGCVDLDQALAEARAAAGPDDVVVIAGSLVLVGTAACKLSSER